MDFFSILTFGIRQGFTEFYIDFTLPWGGFYIFPLQ